MSGRKRGADVWKRKTKPTCKFLQEQIHLPVNNLHSVNNKLCGRPPQHAPAPCKLTFDLLTLKVVSESRVMWATSMPILVFLGLSVLKLGPMYATDRHRQTSDVHHRLMPPPYNDIYPEQCSVFAFKLHKSVH